VDTPTGTAGNDTFKATAAALNVGDLLAGNAGTDTLEIVDAGDVTALNATLKDIEVIDVTAGGSIGNAAGGSNAVVAVREIDKLSFADQKLYNVTITSTHVEETDTVTVTSGSTVITLTVGSGGVVAATDGSGSTAVAINGSANTATSISQGIAKSLNYLAGATVAYVDAGGVVQSIVEVSEASTADYIVEYTEVNTTPNNATSSQEAAVLVASSDADSLIATGKFSITWDGVNVLTAADSSPTAEESAALIASAINGLAGTTVATVVGKEVVLTAPTPGTALPSYTVKYLADGSSFDVTGLVVKTNSVNNVAASAATTVAESTFDAKQATQSVVLVAKDEILATAADTADVTATSTESSVTLEGGKDVDVSAKTAITLTSVEGAVTAVSTDQAANAIQIQGGTDVSVTATKVSTGTVTVGTTDAPSGAVTIDSTGAAYGATANVALGAIAAAGGTSIVVNQTASSDATTKANSATANVTNYTVTQSAVTVTAGDKTESVTITQDAANTKVDGVKAVAEKNASYNIKFSAAAANDVITLTFASNQTIVFTAAKALTAAEVANAFANIAKNGTQGSAARTDGVYTNGNTALDEGWSSGGVSVNAAGTEATVTFTAAGAQTITSIANGGTGTATLGSLVTTGVNKVDYVEGEMGVVGGAVTINGTASGKDALKVVTLSGHSNTTIDSDVIETINLSNSASAVTTTTASTGAVTLNINNITGAAALSVDGGAATVTGITVNAVGTKSAVDVIADAATAVTINAAVDLDMSGSSFNAAKTITVAGAGKVILDEDGNYNAVTSIDASGSTGGVDADARTLGNSATFTGSAAADTLKLGSSTKASTMGDGNDTVTLTGATLGVGGTVDGGNGIDTLVLTTANAVTASDSEAAGLALKADVLNFERLEIQTAAANASVGTQDTRTIKLDNLGFDYIISNGTTLDTSTAANSAIIAFTGAAANSTFVLKAAAAGANTFHTVALKTATGTSDVVNVETLVASDVNYGNFTATDIETVNLTATDSTPVNTSTGEATINTSTLKVTASAAKTINVTGNANVTLDGASTSALTLVDASTLTGKLIYTADGATAGTTVKGGAGNDELTANGSGDVLIGGAGNDTLTGAALSTLTGGEGNDTFVLNVATKATYSTITDLSAGDVISLGTVAAFKADAVVLAATATFDDYLAAAVNAVTADGGDEVAWFQFGGNTFIARDSDSANDQVDGSETWADGTDAIIAITGLIDLSKAVFNATADTLTIV